MRFSIPRRRALSSTTESRDLQYIYNICCVKFSSRKYRGEGKIYCRRGGSVGRETAGTQIFEVEPGISVPLSRARFGGKTENDPTTTLFAIDDVFNRLIYIIYSSSSEEEKFDIPWTRPGFRR